MLSCKKPNCAVLDVSYRPLLTMDLWFLLLLLSLSLPLLLLLLLWLWLWLLLLLFCCVGDLYFDNKGMFSIEEETNGTQIKFHLYPNATISWIKGAPPADAPECGFENEKCVEEETPKLSKSNRHSLESCQSKEASLTFCRLLLETNQVKLNPLNDWNDVIKWKKWFINIFWTSYDSISKLITLEKWRKIAFVCANCTGNFELSKSRQFLTTFCNVGYVTASLIVHGLSSLTK